MSGVSIQIICLYTGWPESHFTEEKLNISAIVWPNRLIFLLWIKECSYFISIRKRVKKNRFEISLLPSIKKKFILSHVVKNSAGWNFYRHSFIVIIDNYTSMQQSTYLFMLVGNRWIVLEPKCSNCLSAYVFCRQEIHFEKLYLLLEMFLQMSIIVWGQKYSFVMYLCMYKYMSSQKRLHTRHNIDKEVQTRRWLRDRTQTSVGRDSLCIWSTA